MVALSAPGFQGPATAPSSSVLVDVAALETIHGELRFALPPTASEADATRLGGLGKHTGRRVRRLHLPQSLLPADGRRRGPHLRSSFFSSILPPSPVSFLEVLPFLLDVLSPFPVVV